MIVMASEMLERVARAICNKRAEVGLQRDWTMSLATRPLAERIAEYVNLNWKAYEDDARIAISAMREPTDAMMEFIMLRKDDYELGLKDWRSAIDEALK